jgi:hypothetical protein
MLIMKDVNDVNLAQSVVKFQTQDMCGTRERAGAHSSIISPKGLGRRKGGVSDSSSMHNKAIRCVSFVDKTR